jgi:peptide-methionine (R)-S-oxide reductase
MKNIMLSVLGCSLFIFVSCINSPEPDKTKIIMAADQTGSKLSLSDTSLVKVVKTNEEWKKILSPLQYNILREQGTEPPFDNPYWDNHEKGNYFCSGCNLPLFSSETKFESGTGWPSFYAPLSNSFVKEVVDESLGMVRGEIVCARCDGHLGHLFNDGPNPTGLRYCMDSASLIFQK